MNLPTRKVKQKLTKLWTGEIAAAISFWGCFFVMKVWLTDTQMFIAVIYPLSVLTFILVQGSVYWWILSKRLSAPRFAAKYTGKIYGVIKIADAFLLCLGLPIIVVHHKNTAVTILSAFILIFAAVEWINYYKTRLSYSYNPIILLRHIKNGTLERSRLAKEIQNRSPTG